MREPNNLLRDARLRRTSPSGSGRVMSRQEVAEAVNAWLYTQTGRVYHLDANYVGKLEQGRRCWPSEPIQRALRTVLDANQDADLGLYNPRRPPTTEDTHARATRPTGRPAPVPRTPRDFGRYLKALRQQRGLSLRRLGQQAHYSHECLWQLETGGKRPTEAAATALDAALGTGDELATLAARHQAARAGNAATTSARASIAAPIPMSGGLHRAAEEFAR